jgi:hypothetical protein
MNRSVIRSLIAASAVVLLAACTSITGADVESKSETDAIAVVQQRADQVAQVIGAALTNPSNRPGPCSGKLGETDSDIFAVQGAYNIDQPVEKHVETFTKLRDRWKADGYTITADRTFGVDGSGVITAKSPDGFSFNVESTSPPTGFAVLVHSPCYKSPTPR